jgi:hypothetical protein
MHPSVAGVTAKHRPRSLTRVLRLPQGLCRDLFQAPATSAQGRLLLLHTNTSTQELPSV